MPITGFKTIALAIIQRNRVAINSLCRVTDELHNTDEVGSDEFDNELARVYKVISPAEIWQSKW